MCARDKPYENEEERMLRHVYRILTMCVIFAAAVYFYGRGVEVETMEREKTVEVGGSTFPILNITSQGYQMNRLFGYSGDLDVDTVRESITPLGPDKSLDVSIKEYAEEIQKVIYEVRDVRSNEVLDSGSISALERVEGGKATRISLETELDTSTEYSLKITAVTVRSRKIHYFTRLKYYVADSFLQEKLDFVMRFHKDTFIKNPEKQKLGVGTAKQGVQAYLEAPALTKDNDALARVDIHSSPELVMWGEVEPKVVTDVIPTVKEFNIETGAFQLTYFVEFGGKAAGKRYFVNEFYRVRYASGQFYLLYFERTMESQFGGADLNLEENILELGVTSDVGKEVVANSDQSKMCFVRDGALYYYDVAKNEFTKVYAFYQEDVVVEQRLYAEHDVQIIKMDDEGNICFAVYGYMSRGDYEGKVAIVLYQFHVVDDVIEELAYVPLQTTYQRLKEDFERHCYMNAQDDFYLKIFDKVLVYNTVAKSLKVMAENVTEENFYVLKRDNCYVWADSSEGGEVADRIHIEHLDTGDALDIPANDGEGVTLLGMMDEHVIYGRYLQSDVTETTDGTVVVPVNQLEIVDAQGKVLRTEEGKGYYFTDVAIKDNIITITRCEKKKNGNEFTFEEVDERRLTSTFAPREEPISYTARDDEEFVREWFVALPKPKEEGAGDDAATEGDSVTTTTFLETKNYVITTDTTLHLDNLAKDREMYYVYAYGRITGSSRNPAKAIRKAYDDMGVVISAENYLVWERGGKFLQNAISGIEHTKAEGKLGNVGACTYMLLKASHASVDVSDASGGKTSILGLMRKYLDYPVNLSGCELDDALYFVSAGKPVIGMVGKKEAVLIVGYDQYYVDVVDPKTGQAARWGLNSAAETFRAANNVFVSYLE